MSKEKSEKTGEKEVIGKKSLLAGKKNVAGWKEDASSEGHFPIVGIGASAGGLEAVTKLLEALPDDTGMAFVVVQHLAPGQESMLTDILARSSKMPVHRVQNDMQVECENVYVIPPGVSMTIANGVLKLQRDSSRVPRPINQFLVSLAQGAKNLAIGVILSGTGSDGTEGLKAIYAEGGITFAQDEGSAKYPGMPHSAIMSESVHFVLTPKKIAGQLVRIGKHPYLNHTELKVVKPRGEFEDAYQNILALLKLGFNVNFSAYKESTINRRISRRMVIHQIEKVEDYVVLLRSNKAELQALFDDLLIGVTSFFREPETFQVLAEKVFPVLLKDRSPDLTVRVWVPGCATGEEVYSLALSLREYMEKTGSSVRAQIFGTDISDKNIEKARAGIFPENISENISEERLRHFFNKVNQSYQVNKSIRDTCVFAKQDITRDPPFSNLDLVSCRNLLIYLKPEAQRRIIPLFHYALKPKAYLVLGKSESISSYDALFDQIDKTSIYMKKMTATRIPLEIELSEGFGRKQPFMKKQQTAKPLEVLHSEVEQVIMRKFSPPGVVVNDNLNVLLFQGNTAQFLAHGPGEANLDLMKMVKAELRLELQTAIYVARKQKAPVKRENIQFRHNGSYSQVDLEVVPIVTPQTNENFFLVLFEGVEPLLEKKQVNEVRRHEEVRDDMVRDLKRELTATKETLQTIIEEQEGTNEELRAALEEVQSSNEELQSTNEELETAKEELQSTNEELNTVNEELSRRNKELSRAHDDLANLFTNIDVAVIVLDSSLKIRLYTPSAEKLFSLIQADAGRPITDISLGISIENFDDLLHEVMEQCSAKNMEIRDKKGRWYEMRLRPYLTAEKKIDGVVLSFVDIDSIIRSRAEIEKARKFSETVVATTQEPLIVLDANLKIAMANPSFYNIFGIGTEDVVNKHIYTIADKQWQFPQFKDVLEGAIHSEENVVNFIIDHNFPKLGRKVLNLNVGKLALASDQDKMWILTLQEITHATETEEGLRKNKKELEQNVEDKTRKLEDAHRLAVIGQTAGMVGHDIRNPLQSIVSATYMLKEELLDAIEGQTDEQKKKKNEILESVEMIEEQTDYINKIVSDLQEFSRTASPISQEVDLNILIKSLLARLKIPDNVKVNTNIADDIHKISSDPTCLTRILTNLINNAIQAMPNGGNLTINAQKDGDQAVLTVGDTGEGIPENIKPKLFQPLVTSKSKGQGFGLAVCKRLTEAMKGEITFESERGKGTKFIIKLPIEH